MQDNERLENVEKKVNDIYDYLVGNDFSNGLKNEIKDFRRFKERTEKIIWMVLGGSAVISALVGFLVTII